MKVETFKVVGEDGKEIEIIEYREKISASTLEGDSELYGLPGYKYKNELNELESVNLKGDEFRTLDGKLLGKRK